MASKPGVKDEMKRVLYRFADGVVTGWSLLEQMEIFHQSLRNVV